MNRLNERTPSDYMVRLSDGETYCFYPSTNYDPRSLKTVELGFKVRTITSVQDEDWKTAIAQHKERIPANTELEVLNVLTNFYGRWLEVVYNNSHHYIDPSKVEFAGKIDKEIENERFRRCS